MKKSSLSDKKDLILQNIYKKRSVFSFLNFQLYKKKIDFST